MLPDRRGFSIVGVIVAAGMLGGLALFLANITREQHVTQRKAETGVEITALQRKILSVLYDGEACTATLGPDSFLPLGSSTRSLTQLKNKAGGRNDDEVGERAMEEGLFAIVAPGGDAKVAKMINPEGLNCSTACSLRTKVELLTWVVGYGVVFCPSAQGFFPYADKKSWPG